MKKFQLIIALLCLINIQAFACTCYEITTKEAINGAQIVMKGKVISKILTHNLSDISTIKTSDTTNIHYVMAHRVLMAVVKIKVNKLYKGKISLDTITMITPKMSASCGFNFQIGDEYYMQPTTTRHLCQANFSENQKTSIPIGRINVAETCGLINQKKIRSKRY